jgi:hypothetical protein
MAQQTAAAAQQKAQATPAVKSHANQASQAAQQAQQVCLNCQQEATKAANAAQTAATSSGPVAQTAAQQAQQAANNAVAHAQQTIQHAQTAATHAAQAGATMPANAAMPLVKITPANAGYLDMSTLSNAIGGLASGVSTVGAPLTQFPQQLAAALSGNPIAQQLAQNPTCITPQIKGDARQLTSSYLGWKKRCDFPEYIQARKYFTWKSHCHKCSKSEKTLEDWAAYGKWKEAEWRFMKTEVPFMEYVDWKMTAEPEDAEKYREWRTWKNTKAKYKGKFEEVM